MADLYSYKGAYPYPLPADMTGYNMTDFVLAPIPPALNPGQVLDWDGKAWVVRNPSAAELEIQWFKIRTERDDLLKQSDILVLRDFESGNTVSANTVTYRQALRNIPQTETDPFNITWPILT